MGQEAAPAPQTDEKTSLIVTQDYFIGPEDVLDITVWKNPISPSKSQFVLTGEFRFP